MLVHSKTFWLSKDFWFFYQFPRWKNTKDALINRSRKKKYLHQILIFFPYKAVLHKENESKNIFFCEISWLAALKSINSILFFWFWRVRTYFWKIFCCYRQFCKINLFHKQTLRTGRDKLKINLKKVFDAWKTF